MIDASAIGSSSNAVTSGTRSISMCGSRISSWWLVPRRSATMRAQLDSSNEGSEKPIEKLFTLPGVSSAIVAATALESIPPERKTPIGTSATSSLRTASLSAARRLAAQDVPGQKSEHANEVAEEGVAALLIRVQHALGVGVRRHRVAKPDQLRSKLGVVVDLPVEDDPQRAVLIADRLVAAGEVDDRQPPATARDALAYAGPFVVRPSMRDAGAHSVEHLRNRSGIAPACE